MAHEAKKEMVRMNCVDVEQVNIDLRLDQKQPQAKMEVFLKKLSKERKPVKKSLRKLFKKAELNSKYPEQVIPIQRLERQRIYRNYGLR
ncbi:MAG: hypothetical protein ACXACX_10295 [Candidatus Hodarchaeales archaeon]|jgi:hypothetical protein